MTSIYFQHENSGHSIGVKLCESEVESGTAILRFTVHPVGANQKYDEQYLHEQILSSATIDDKTIIDGFVNYIERSREHSKAYRLELISKGKTLKFIVTPETKSHGAVEALYLNVCNG